MNFIVTVSREWTEYGTTEIEADNEDEAYFIATGMMLENNNAIQWQTDNMSSGENSVESVVAEN